MRFLAPPSPKQVLTNVACAFALGLLYGVVNMLDGYSDLSRQSQRKLHRSKGRNKNGVHQCLER